ncbi:MAG: AAA family ATPase, partial [Mycobacteriaceae bacterium]
MGQWPLTGRGEEMNVLAGMLDDVSSPTALVIAGGAGIGKTRLARETAAVAERQGWVVRYVQGTAAAQAIPLGPFAQWIDQLDDQPLTVVSSIITAVTASPENHPVLIVVDDAQLLDDLSAFVLHQLVQRRLATVIATLRTGETLPKSLTELWKDGHLRRLDLQPLSRQQCSALLDSALG